MVTRKGILRTVSIALPAVLLCFVFAPRANAGQWNELTRISFSGPVEVPGHVLPAGTYDFQLMNSSSNRDIVEIFNKNRTRLFAIVMAEAAYRLRPTDRTVITFAERPVGTPEAIHKWFYPGNYYGVRFVYSHSRIEMAATRAKTRSARG